MSTRSRLIGRRALLLVLLLIAYGLCPVLTLWLYQTSWSDLGLPEASKFFALYWLVLSVAAATLDFFTGHRIGFPAATAASGALFVLNAAVQNLLA